MKAGSYSESKNMLSIHKSQVNSGGMQRISGVISKNEYETRFVSSSKSCYGSAVSVYENNVFILFGLIKKKSFDI